MSLLFFHNQEFIETGNGSDVLIQDLLHPFGASFEFSYEVNRPRNNQVTHVYLCVLNINISGKFFPANVFIISFFNSV